MKKFLLFALAMAWASTAAAQQRSASFAHLYDVDSTSLTYCVMTGQNGDPFGGAMVGSSRIKTAAGGGSTTVTEFVSGALPFAQLSVGDTIIVDQNNSTPPVSQTVIVTAKASGASITVSTAMDLDNAAGHDFRWLKQTCGTAITNGWINVEDATGVAMTVQYEQGDLTGLRVRWECVPKGVGAAPVIVYPGQSSDCGIGGTLSTDRCDFATPGETARLMVSWGFPNSFQKCRIGLAYHTADASDAAANLEQVTATIVKSK
jgi:hypothetical protein